MDRILFSPHLRPTRGCDRTRVKPYCDARPAWTVVRGRDAGVCAAAEAQTCENTVTESQIQMRPHDTRPHCALAWRTPQARSHA
eukprot:6014612-Prymnesium_polylepis.1